MINAKIHIDIARGLKNAAGHRAPTLHASGSRGWAWKNFQIRSLMLAR